MCVESFMEFGSIMPGTCVSAHLHFIAIKGKFHVVEVVQTIGYRNGEQVEMKGHIQIHVMKTLSALA
ncbi:hypothetical protein BC829DRAFT_401834, partial [Chytridium lagenaria]